MLSKWLKSLFRSKKTPSSVKKNQTDLVSRLGIAGVELALCLVIAQGVRASRTAGLLRLAEELQRVLIAEGRQEAPIDEHVAPCKTVLLPVVPVGIDHDE